MSSDDDTSEQNGSAQSGDGVRQRRKSHSSTNGSAVPEDTTDSRAEPEYTTDQLQAVRRYLLTYLPTTYYILTYLLMSILITEKNYFGCYSAKSYWRMSSHTINNSAILYQKFKLMGWKIDQKAFEHTTSNSTV